MRPRAATGIDVSEVEQEGRRHIDLRTNRIVQSHPKRDQPRSIGLNQVRMHESETPLKGQPCLVLVPGRSIQSFPCPDSPNWKRSPVAANWNNGPTDTFW